VPVNVQVIALPGVAPATFAVHALMAFANGAAGAPRHVPPGFTQHAEGACVNAGTASPITILVSG
jgi:hypothetical protein